MSDEDVSARNWNECKFEIWALKKLVRYGILISLEEERNQMKNVCCMNCSSSGLHLFIDLRDEPNVNHFSDAESRDKEPMFPFAMMVYTDFYQVQIEELPLAEFMFEEHSFVAGINQPVIVHFAKMASSFH